MLPEQWDAYKRAAKLEKLDKVPMAMIIDSPWIPGYLGIEHLDYYLNPDLWFQSNLKIMREFPDIIFVPSWWMEYGMAAEPSILGAKIKFWEDNTPSEYHTLYRLEDIAEFPEYEVEADAFAAMTLHRYKMHKQQILDHGYVLPFVSITGEVSMFKLPESIDERYRAHYLDIDVYGSVNFTRWAGAQVGYHRFNIDYEIDNDKGDLHIGGLYFAGVLRY